MNRKRKKDSRISALAQVKSYLRNVIVGAPGSGKSTFLEWLQVKLASVEEELVMGGQQAIPLLLRVRQLDPLNLPRGAELIEKATGSKDRAALMPDGWIHRQMKAGRVLFMLDGLDETDPDTRDRYVLPWLLELYKEYPVCGYLVSSRPAGYPPGTLREFKFAECDLLDFDETQIGEYTRHWCTAVRLAQNEPEEEARREGTADGEHIVDGFKGHPYIRNLARNPLMLSAICLVNYFEGGHLPQDRALLYKLCVEGLLHNWDQRRGIRSEFTFEEKLRACREVALTMQANDRAEYEADEVRQIFVVVLRDPTRAEKLLEHIRYRTGLLLERRPGIFAFAHLTFQEYLAARAVHEGNQLGVDVERLVREHDDSRWQEVIALYCGFAPTPAASDIVERLLAQHDTLSLSDVLGEAYFSSGPELGHDHKLHRRVLERIAVAPSGANPQLDRFSTDEVAPIANLCLGRLASDLSLSGSYLWLLHHPDRIDFARLAEKLQDWRRLTPYQTGEMIYLLHCFGPDALLVEIASDADMYSAPAPQFRHGPRNITQAEVALLGLSSRKHEKPPGIGADLALLQTLRVFSRSTDISLDIEMSISLKEYFEWRNSIDPPYDAAAWPEFASLGRRLAELMSNAGAVDSSRRRNIDVSPTINALNVWTVTLECAIAKRQAQPTQPKLPHKSKTTTRQTAKKKTGRRQSK